MSPEILLIREGHGYRILHGLLHLASALNSAREAIAEVSGEGRIKVMRARNGIGIETKDGFLPLLGPLTNPLRDMARRLSEEA